jgi:hypothetical protein
LNTYADHPEILNEDVSIRQILVQMFESEALVDQALKIVFDDDRCFEKAAADSDPIFKGLGCVDTMGQPDTGPLTIAIVGCGQMGWAHCINATVDPRISVRWVVDVNKDFAIKLAKMPALADAPPQVATDYLLPLKDANLDAVLILTPPSTHKVPPPPQVVCILKY